MRKLTIVVTVAALVAAGFPTSPVLAQAPASCPSMVRNFPDGGPLLKDEVINEIKNNLDLANNFTACLEDPSLTPGQQATIHEALGELYQAGILTVATPGLSTTTIALIALLAAGAGVGIYELSKSNGCFHGSVSPSC